MPCTESLGLSPHIKEDDEPSPLQALDLRGGYECRPLLLSWHHDLSADLEQARPGGRRRLHAQALLTADEPGGSLR